MITISYKGLGGTFRGKVLWQFTYLALIQVVWREKNTKIFWDKAKTSEGLWDIIHFLASFQAFCTITFKGILLDIIQLVWMSVHRSNGVGQQRLITFVYSHMGCGISQLYRFTQHFGGSYVFFVQLFWRIPHPSFVIIITYLNILYYCLSSKKKKVKPTNQIMAKSVMSNCVCCLRLFISHREPLLRVDKFWMWYQQLMKWYMRRMCGRNGECD